MKTALLRAKIKSLRSLQTLNMFIICTLYFALCVWGSLRNWSNYDETFTNVYSSMNLSDIFATMKYEASPPLHYLTYHFWFALFGSGLFSARMLSSIFSVGCIIVCYFLGKTLSKGSIKAGVICALTCAILPVSYHLAAEGRYFTMLSFYSLVATYLLLKIYPLHDAEEMTTRRNIALHSFYAFFISLSFYSSYMGIFLFPAHLLYVAFYIVKRFRSKSSSKEYLKRSVLSIIWTAGLLVILNLPLFYCYLHSTRLPGGDISGLSNRLSRGYAFIKNTLNTLFSANFVAYQPREYLFLITQCLFIAFYTLMIVVMLKVPKLRSTFAFLILSISAALVCVIFSPTLGFANYRYINTIFYLLGIGIGLIFYQLGKFLNERRAYLVTFVVIIIMFAGVLCYGAKPFLAHKGGQTSGTTDFGIVNAVNQAEKKYAGNKLIMEPPNEIKTWLIIAFSDLVKEGRGSRAVYVHNFDQQIEKRFENCDVMFCNNRKFVDLLIKNSGKVVQGDEIYDYVKESDVKFILAYDDEQLSSLKKQGLDLTQRDTFCNEIGICLRVYEVS